jgi:hypothetical protein
MIFVVKHVKILVNAVDYRLQYHCIECQRFLSMMKKISIRQCQPCTSCCEGWLQTVINGVKVFPGHRCPQLTEQGCCNYAQRPIDPCVQFNCGWVVKNSPLPDWMRPDQARVLVILRQSLWRGMIVNLAVPVGEKIPRRALRWLQHFSEAQQQPLIYTEQIAEQIVQNGQFQAQQQVMAYGPPAFQQAVIQRHQKGAILW